MEEIKVGYVIRGHRVVEFFPFNTFEEHINALALAYETASELTNVHGRELTAGPFVLEPDDECTHPTAMVTVKSAFIDSHYAHKVTCALCGKARYE